MDPPATRTAPPPPSWRWVRVVVWVLPMIAPMLWLWALIENPRADAELWWQHEHGHLLLMLAASLLSLGLALKIVSEARRRNDARLFFVAISFLLAAGFLGLHGLTTPGALVDRPGAGFVIAVPVGLALAAVPALAATWEMSAERSRRVVDAAPVVLAAIAAVFVGWGLVSVLLVPPLDRPVVVEEHRGALAWLAVPTAVAYLVAAVRLYQRYRDRPSPVLLSILSSFVISAEASLALLIGRNWQASWWTWHVLLLAAFVLVTYAAFVEAGREGSADELFVSAGLEETIAAIQHDHASALDELVAAVEAGRSETIDQMAAGMAQRFGLSARQVQLLAQAADALGSERAQQRRLTSVVAAGNESTVARSESELLAAVARHVSGGFAPDVVEVCVDPSVARPSGRDVVTEPLHVQRAPAGFVALHRQPGAEANGGGAWPHDRDRAVLRALATQLSVSLENSRLYGQVERLFSQYLSPDVATTLLGDPDSAGLGGEIREITVMFGDLAGFTSFSERTAPEGVVEMLNAYFGAGVPAILERGGTVSNFIGDAIMATFGAPARQRDHALRGVQAALDFLDVTAAVSRAHPEWPVFRVGVNSGPALIGNIGGEAVRAYTAIGDTVNLAARLEAASRPGRVVIGARTHELVGRSVAVTALDPLTVKGKAEPVAAYLVEGLALRAERDTRF